MSEYPYPSSSAEQSSQSASNALHCIDDVLRQDGSNTLTDENSERVLRSAQVDAISDTEFYRTYVTYETFITPRQGQTALGTFVVKRLSFEGNLDSNRHFGISRRLNGRTYGTYGTPGINTASVPRFGRAMNEEDYQLFADEIALLGTIFIRRTETLSD